MKRLICKIFGHKWRMLHRLSFIGLAQCTRCRHYITVHVSPHHPNCRCIAPGAYSKHGQKGDERC